MRPRKSSVFFLFIVIQLFLVCLMAVHASIGRTAAGPALRIKTELVRAYGLTDLCLFTEARYTRHPSQADIHSAFQDGPLSFEHFPAGSLVPPPARLSRASHD